ncbi:hypothetical protein KFR76_00570 [Corynebacterium diphtheriae]|nr:hypothetical protein KFR76_00570 [Corynebacterium diphtheriae]
MNTLNTTAKANTAELIRHAAELGYTVHRINTADTHRPIEVIPTDPTSYIPTLYYTDGQWTIQTTSFGGADPDADHRAGHRPEQRPDHDPNPQQTHALTALTQPFAGDEAAAYDHLCDALEAHLATTTEEEVSGDE